MMTVSSAFDIVQHALITLSKENNLTCDQRALVQAVERIVSDWHELNHKQGDVINLKTRPGALVGVVDTERVLMRLADTPSAATYA